MTVSSVMLENLRRMVNEADDSHGYDDDTLTAILAEYPLIDEQGYEPYTLDTSTHPPTQDANEDWIATYDLHAAAARIWEEKATCKADLYDFSADGGKFSRSQMFTQRMQMVRWHKSQRAVKTIRAFTWPKPSAAASVVANRAESN